MTGSGPSESIGRSFRHREQYLLMCRRNGGKKISAMCAVTRRLVPMLLHLMETAEAFDEARWRPTHTMSPYKAA